MLISPSRTRFAFTQAAPLGWLFFVALFLLPLLAPHAQARAPRPKGPPADATQVGAPVGKGQPVTGQAKKVEQGFEYRNTAARASTVDRLASGLGFGNLVGLGLPVLILVGGSMRVLGLAPPAFLGRIIDPQSPLYSWPFLLLALLALALFALSGNEKLSKGPKLLAQIAGMPPAIFLAVALPVVSELTRPTLTTALLAQMGEPVAGASAAGGLSLLAVLVALAMGVIAFFSASLILLTRLLVSLLVWASPFPFVDALVNMLFHGYALTLVILTFVAPPAALFLMIVQTLVAIFLLRRLLRLGRASLRIGRGAVKWHLFRGRIDEATDVSAWAQNALDQEGAADRPRLMGWVLNVPGEKPHTSATFGSKETGFHIWVARRRRPHHHVVAAAELHEVEVRYGALYDEIIFVHRQGSGQTRREVPLHLGLAKSQRTALRALVVELTERGYDVHDASARRKTPSATLAPVL